MTSAVLRQPDVRSLFNLYTVSSLGIIAYLALTAYLRIIWGDTSGTPYLFLLMLVQLTPIVIALTRRHFTYLAFIMIYHFIQLSISKWILFRDNPKLVETFPEVLQAIQEQIACTVIIILVYHACRAFLFGGMAERERFNVLTLSRPQVVLLCSYVLFVPLFLHHLPAWFLSIHFLLLSADLALLFTSNYPGNRWIVEGTKVAAVITSVTYFLTTGMMTLMGSLVSIGVLVSCLKKKFWPLPFIVLLVMGMSAIQTVKGPFRVIIFSDMGQELGYGERLAALGELLDVKYLQDDGDDFEDDGGDGEREKETIAGNLISGFMRAGDDSLERVLANTPSKIPFWEGETYMGIPFMFIPRALWPDKPSRHFWNKFGRSYGVLDAEDYQTSVTVSYLAEAYMNFGFTAMYIVSMLVGLLIAVVERSAFYILGGNYYFPYIVLMTPLASPGSDLGSMLNSLWVIYMLFIVGRPFLLKMAQRDEYS
jgi:hypothetical protein